MEPTRRFIRKRCAGTRALVCTLFLVLSVSALHAQDPDAQIDLTLGGKSPRPGSGTAAWQSIRARQQAAVAFLACGQELSFLANVRSGDSGPDSVNLALAKMYWYFGLPDRNGAPALTPPANVVALVPPCQQQVQVWADGVPAADDPDHLPAKDASIVRYGQELGLMVNQAAGDLVGTHLNAVFVRLFGAECDSVIQRVALSSGMKYGQTNPSNIYTITYSVTPRCLQSQFNLAFSNMHVTGQMGTGDGTPCHVVGSLSDADANWDMSSRGLIRAVYLDRLYKSLHPRQVMLTPQVRDYIRQKMIITDIHVGEDSYAITACGDSEHAEGSAQDRVDDPGFFQQLGEDLGDFFNWLVKHWYVAIPILPELGADPLINSVAVAGVYSDAVVQSVRVPETENHRLMIESTRYLNNQLLREDLQGDSGRLDYLNEAQQDVHDWLLKRMRDILRNDFIEYHARPYQRESVAALCNLYDFAEDQEVSDGARILLEFAFAKFAVGSNQGRRLVPYRRHMGDLKDHVLDGENVMFTGQAADHQEALGLLYTGQTQQLNNGYAPAVFPSEAAVPAFSWFTPSPVVLDLAIDKTTPYLQRFRHDGMEAYASGKGYLITAGGVVSSPAYTIGGIGNAEDMGAAVPTTLMFPSGIGKATWLSFLQFQGMYKTISGHLKDDPKTSFDGNTCVTKGFACGVNLYVPPDMIGCLVYGPATRENNWAFFNSAKCPGYSDGPAVFVVVYQKPCLLPDPNCQTLGFFEAVDQTVAPTDAAFNAFIADTLARNPAGMIRSPGHSSVYKTGDGRTIEFEPVDPIIHHEATGIRSIDGLKQPNWTDWPGAQGQFFDIAGTSLLTKADAPVVTINNPRLPSKSITLDFTTWSSPTYAAP